MEARMWLEHDLKPIQSIFGAQRRAGRVWGEPVLQDFAFERTSAFPLRETFF